MLFVCGMLLLTSQFWPRYALFSVCHANDVHPSLNFPNAISVRTLSATMSKSGRPEPAAMPVRRDGQRALEGAKGRGRDHAEVRGTLLAGESNIPSLLARLCWFRMPYPLFLRDNSARSTRCARRNCEPRPAPATSPSCWSSQIARHKRRCIVQCAPSLPCHVARRSVRHDEPGCQTCFFAHMDFAH